jgi:hypothetical protein
MPAPEDHWRTPELSSSVAAAIASHREGVTALVAGASHAIGSLEAAVAADPGFEVARVDLALARCAAGYGYDAPPDRCAPTRAERHHIEIVDAICRGEAARAMDLRREHLLEYPGDLLIVWAPLVIPA